MNEKEMQALLRKTQAKAAAKKNPNRPTYDKALDLFSSRLHNVYIEPAFGIVDIRSVAVQ